MIIVRYNHWDEFLSELAGASPEDRTVRLTLSVRYDGQGVAYLTMVAGYLDRTTIVEFVHYLGLQPSDPRSARGEEIRRLLEERKRYLEEQGFRVRSGRYHLPPNVQR